MGGVWSTQLDINLLFSLAFEGLGQQLFDEFFLLAGMGGVWSTHEEMHSVSMLASG